VRRQGRATDRADSAGAPPVDGVLGSISVSGPGPALATVLHPQLRLHSSAMAVTVARSSGSSYGWWRRNGGHQVAAHYLSPSTLLQPLSRLAAAAPAAPIFCVCAYMETEHKRITELDMYRPGFSMPFSSTFFLSAPEYRALRVSDKITTNNAYLGHAFERSSGSLV
jgi:hypothetical protein